MALFVVCVTPCVLYACGTRTVTVDMERELRSTQRRMLRLMIRLASGSDEDWPDYNRQATRTFENIDEQHGCCDWVTAQRVRKSELAAKCALTSDKRWPGRLFRWKPWFRCSAFRHVGVSQEMLD